MFHALQPAPAGGGNQFIRALVGELRRRGLRVELNRLSSRTKACLFNSYNFDAERLLRLKHDGVRMVHRVDGPIAVYRGVDDGADAAVMRLNADLADATVLQSTYSAEASRARGLEYRSPTIVPNAVDPRIFHPPASRRPARKMRLISTSWSPNPRKGGPLYRWLAENLDRDRFEYTFVGHVSEALPGVRVVPPVSSVELANALREHDIFVTASLAEACSNALFEALACGLPALYVESGSHAEQVGGGGVGFSSPDDVLDALDLLVAEYDDRRAAISVPSLADVTDRYLEILNLAG